MLQVSILTTDPNSPPKLLKPADLATAAELQQAIDQARHLIRECERLVTAKLPPQPPRKAPYS
jgi:hypothetical protein